MRNAKQTVGVVAAFLTVVSIRPTAFAQQASPSLPRAVETPADSFVIAAPSVFELRRRVRDLRAQKNAERVAGNALRHAELAIEKAVEFSAKKFESSAVRARQIAWAALSLASSQFGREQSVAGLRAATRRKAGAEARARRSRAALQHALREQASIPAGSP